MPICTKCLIDKPEILFRLVKKHFFDKATLFSVCVPCEMLPKNICFRCSKGLADWEIFKRSNKMVYCKKCSERVAGVKAALVRIKLEKRINNLIKKVDTMPNGSISDLRDHLFQTITGLKEGTISPDVAAQITDVAKTIIDSARVENEFIELTKSAGSGFIPLRDRDNLISNHE